MPRDKKVDEIGLLQISTQMELTRKHVPGSEFAEILKLPRHALALNRKVLRQFLALPIKEYKIKSASVEERDRMIQKQTDDRLKALFALYNVPEILSAEEQWRWLALGLAGEWFAGCKTLKRGFGGPRRSTLTEKRKAKESLFRQFEAYRRTTRLSEIRAAETFRNKHRVDCSEAGLKTAKSFAQAMRALRKESGIITEVEGS